MIAYRQKNHNNELFRMKSDEVKSTKRVGEMVTNWKGETSTTAQRIGGQLKQEKKKKLSKEPSIHPFS